MMTNTGQNQSNQNLDMLYKNKQIFDFYMKLQLLHDASFSFLSQKWSGWIKHLGLPVTSKKYFLSHLKS